MEKLLLKHMWKIAFFFWSIVFISWVLQYINLPVWWFVQNLFWITDIKNTISTQYMFTTIWAIFAFWYWYKKYERDKELELINNFGSKYDNLNSEKNYKGILNLWCNEFYLYNQWYISDKLWKEWSFFIQDKIFVEIFNTLSLNNNLGKNKENIKINLLEEFTHFKRYNSKWDKDDFINLILERVYHIQLACEAKIPTLLIEESNQIIQEYLNTFEYKPKKKVKCMYFNWKKIIPKTN
jgi:hypothetical protein